MKLTRLLVAWLALSLVLSGCAQPAYRMAQTNQGYLIKNGQFDLREYTMDEKGDLPQDEELAEERFHRRKETVRRWYKKYHWNMMDHPSKPWFFWPLGLVLGPFILIAKGLETQQDRHEARQGTEKIREKIRVEDQINYDVAYQKLLDYIAEDCQTEK